MKLSPSLIFALTLSLVLLCVLVGGLSGGAIDFDAVQSLMGQVQESKTAIFIVIFIFVTGSFLGAPQWALITACVVGFGPLLGGFYAWVATLCSASANFYLARLLGQRRLSRLQGPRLSRILARVERNGMLWSFVVRLVPTGPFILVNSAAGLSTIRYPAFLAGTAFGIIPKILVMGHIAKGNFVGLDGKIISLIFIGLAILAIVMTFWFQKTVHQKGHKV